jgi:dynein heavy chain
MQALKKKLFQNNQDQSASAIEQSLEMRRNSVVSNAPSDTSRSDTLSRSGRFKEEEKPVSFQVQPQPKNFFQRVQENKEINKLVSLLSTAINSTKKDVLNALDRFSHYHVIWEKDRDEELEEFMKQDPRLSEFEAEILHYEELEAQIMAEAEYYNVGPIALFTGKKYSATMG